MSDKIVNEARSPDRLARTVDEAATWLHLPDSSVASILKERHATHGEFSYQAHTAQEIKKALHSAAGWSKLSVIQKEVVESIATKLSRIVTGNPNGKDHWHDIAGYATLAYDRIGLLRKDDR